MPARLTARLATLVMLVVGAVVVPATAASAISFQCGSYFYNGSFKHRACIDDTAQGDMWHEIQIVNTSTSTKSLQWNISFYNGVTFPCGTFSATIGAGQTYKRYCVSVRYTGRHYMTFARTIVGANTVVADSPLVYIP
jgi:hypothetical protein